MEENKISITLDDGNELECKILFTFEYEEQVYVAFTEAEESEDNSVFVAKVDEQSDGSGKLSEVEDEAVYDYAAQLLGEYEAEHYDCECGHDHCDCGDEECDCHHGEDCDCNHGEECDCKKHKN